MQKLRAWGAALGAALLLTSCGTGPAQESGTTAEGQTPPPTISASALPSHSSEPNAALPTPDGAAPEPSAGAAASTASPEVTPEVSPEISPEVSPAPTIPGPSSEVSPTPSAEPEHEQAVYPEGVVKLEGGERERYIERAKDTVSVQITLPETAVFSEEEDEWAVFRAGEYVEISSWVDGESTTGETVHSTFTVQFKDGNVAYMRIDDAESGTKLK